MSEVETANLSTSLRSGRDDKVVFSSRVEICGISGPKIGTWDSTIVVYVLS